MSAHTYTSRHAIDPARAKAMDTAALREAFHLPGLTGGTRHDGLASNQQLEVVAAADAVVFVNWHASGH